MDKHLEQERLQTQCLRLSKYAALLRQANVAPEQRALQCLQNLALVNFLSTVQENAFRLFDLPGETQKIGLENLERLDTFLEEYISLMEREYSCYENSPSEP